MPSVYATAPGAEILSRQDGARALRQAQFRKRDLPGEQNVLSEYCRRYRSERVRCRLRKEIGCCEYTARAASFDGIHTVAGEDSARAFAAGGFATRYAERFFTVSGR